jgi:hypothetical protein
MPRLFKPAFSLSWRYIYLGIKLIVLVTEGDKAKIVPMMSTRGATRKLTPMVLIIYDHGIQPHIVL